MEERWLELASLFESRDIRPTLANKRRIEELIEINQEMMDQSVHSWEGWNLEDLQVKLLVDRGRISSERGDRREAKDWYLKALDKGHQSIEAKYHWVRALVNWGVVLYKEGQQERAREIWEKVCEDFGKFDHPELQEGLLKTHINLFHGSKKKLKLSRLPKFLKPFLKMEFDGVRESLGSFFLGYFWPYRLENPLLDALIALVSGSGNLSVLLNRSPGLLKEAYELLEPLRRKQLLAANHIDGDLGLKKKLLLSRRERLFRFEEEALFGPGKFDRPVPGLKEGMDSETLLPGALVGFISLGATWVAVHRDGEVSASEPEIGERLEENLGPFSHPLKIFSNALPCPFLDANGIAAVIQKDLSVLKIELSGLPEQQKMEMGGAEGSSFWFFHSQQGIYSGKGKIAKELDKKHHHEEEPTIIKKGKANWYWGGKNGSVGIFGGKKSRTSHSSAVELLSVADFGLLSAGEDRKVYLLDLDTMKKQSQWHFDHPIEALVPHGERFFVLTQTGLYLVNPSTGGKLGPNLVPGLSGGVSLQLDGSQLVLGDRKGKVHFLRRREDSWKVEHSRIGHGDWPQYFLPLKKGWVSGALNGSILQWDQEHHVVEAFTPVPSHHLGFWKKNLWYSVSDNFLQFWEDTQEPLGYFGAGGDLITAVKVAQEEERLLALGDEGGHLWVLETLSGVPLFSRQLPSPVLTLFWMTGQTLVFGLWNGEWGKVDLSTKRMNIMGKAEGSILSLTASGAEIFTGDNQGFITAWSPEGEILWKSEPMGEAITAMEIHPFDKTLYCGGGKGSMLIIGSTNGDLLGEWQEKGRTVWHLEISGDILFMRREGKDVKLWLLPGFGPPLSLKGHRQNVESVVLLPGGQGLVTASGDGFVRIWRLPDGELVRKIAGPKDGISSMSTNGKEIWVLSKSGSPLRYPLK